MATKLDKVDVVTIGTGFSAGIPTAELTKKGYQVVALETGDDQEHADFIGAKDELRYVSRKGMMLDHSIETITSRNNMDEEAFPLRTQDEIFVGTDVGGSAVHWNGITKRVEFDFEARSKIVDRYGEDKIPKDMLLQDWGITYEELEEYYDKFEKTCGISGEPDPIGPSRSSDYPTPPMKETPSLKLFKEATEALGYHPFQVPSANITERYENPDGQVINACVYCAFCEYFGCDFGAKADPLNTVIGTSRETGNYEIRTKAHARRIIHDGNKATGVLYVDLKTGEEYEQPADVVILGAYIYANARLLMLSEIGENYDPEKKTGVIGKNVNHTNTFGLSAHGFFQDKKFNLAMGAGALGATISDLDSESIDNTDLDFIGGGDLSLMQYGDRPIAVNDVPKDTPGWGAEFKDKSLHYANRRLQVGIDATSFGWSFNYMDLDPNYKDKFNDPLLRMTYRYTDQDKKIGKFLLNKAENIMEEMGADIVEKDDFPEEWDHKYPVIGGGGVIMGDDPETSAVNNYSQMWDMENLFVIGASSFPNQLCQPTNTVGALAYRAAEGIIDYLENDGGLLVEPKEES